MTETEKRVPEMRFSGFFEDWEQRKFEEMLDKNDGVRRGPFGSSLKKEIFVENSDYVVYEQQNAIYDNYKTRYNISKEKFDELHKFSLKENDFIMSGAGTIGRISSVPKGIKPGVFNQALIRFRINSELTDPKYFLQFIRAENMQRKLTGANPGSAITNLVPMAEVKNWEIFVPAKAEQSKLGTFFNHIDNTIALHLCKQHQLKALKQSLIKDILPQNDSVIPRLRFANFNKPWEQHQLKAVLKINSGRDYKHLNEGDIPVYGTGGYMLSVDGKLSNVDGIGLGRKGTIDNPQYLKAPFWTVDTLFYLTPFPNHDIYFLFTLTQSINWKTMDESTGVPSLSKAVIEKVTRTFPSLEEQQKIGSFFKQLDETISHHQQKIDNMQSLKRTLLNKMFI